MMAGYIPTLTRGKRMKGLSALPGSAEMLTVDAAGQLASPNDSERWRFFDYLQHRNSRL